MLKLGNFNDHFGYFYLIINKQSDEELADTLTAISVVANRLAKKLRSAPAQEASDKKGGNDHGKDE